MKNKQQLTRKGYLKKNRERIFKNNRVELSLNERGKVADEEIVRKLGSTYQYSITNVDIYDPYTSVEILMGKDKRYIGYSKRMPNDVPNDRIAIQVAVSRLIKRLKND